MGLQSSPHPRPKNKRARLSSRSRLLALDFFFGCPTGRFCTWALAVSRAGCPSSFCEGGLLGFSCRGAASLRPMSARSSDLNVLVFLCPCFSLWTPPPQAFFSPLLALLFAPVAQASACVHPCFNATLCLLRLRSPASWSPVAGHWSRPKKKRDRSRATQSSPAL